MILESYVQFVKSNYSGAIIVFDGYENEPSTKVMTQMKRRGATSAPKVVFKESNAVSLKRDAFLTNNENKQALVNHLGIHLIKAGYQVKHASADADTLIAKTAIDAVQDQNVTLVADDTDLLCLLLFHLSVNAPYRLTMKTKSARQYDIKLLKESLGVEMCRHILFAHAITGCDTTSRIHGIGKPTVMKLLSTDSIFRRVSAEFLNSENPFSKDTIAVAGETAVKMLYGETGDCNIDKLRLKKIKIKASSKSRITQIEPSSLPPTKAACVQHSLRVFHQIQTWISFETQLPPTEWGWELKENGILWPIYTTKPLAPEDLLKIIKCGCKGDCNTNRCVCYKNGLSCSDICQTCRGISCSNGESATISEEDDV